jgi:hypothetical protein
MSAASRYDTGVDAVEPCSGYYTNNFSRCGRAPFLGDMREMPEDVG